MSMMIKTHFGEFHFNLDKQDEQEILNLALDKATGRSEAKCMDAPAPETPKPAPDSVTLAALVLEAVGEIEEELKTEAKALKGWLERMADG